ncbi:hypothetical protein BSL78_15901, partial [Apostichopus japonicus]
KVKMGPAALGTGGRVLMVSASLLTVTVIDSGIVTITVMKLIVPLLYQGSVKMINSCALWIRSAYLGSGNVMVIETAAIILMNTLIVRLLHAPLDFSSVLTTFASMWKESVITRGIGDYSDEEGCTPEPFRCASHMYQCYGTETCISVALVCNEEEDCPNGDDESNLCNADSCETFNGGCSQICQASPFGAVCDCREGFRINGTKHCVDINECDKLGVCSQFCTNTHGGFVCRCAEGYTVIPDRGRCVHTDPSPPMMFVSTSYNIIQYNLLNQESDLFIRNSLVTEVHYLKTDCGRLLYLKIRLHSNSILYLGDRIRLLTSNGFNSKIISGGVDITMGLVVDWVGRHIYWLDNSVKAIEVANMDGSDRMYLVTENISFPRGFELDPRDGKRFMFWTSIETDAIIERCDLDGQNRQIIMAKDLYQVTGLTLDLPAERVYYADGRLDYIASCNYDGSNVQRIDILALVRTTCI